MKKPHGSWKSPITSSLIVESSIRLGDIVVDGEDLYWNELRPQEKGRSVIVRWRNGKKEDVLPSPYSARTRVHEYGGGAFTVHNETLYFSNFKDQGFYFQKLNNAPEKICGNENKRYANPLYDPHRSIIYAIQEEHCADGKVINSLVKIGKEAQVIHEGHDFYSMPALHPKGTHLAFITWDHPNMPWDGTSLWIGRLTDDGHLEDVKKVAGGIDESIFQPQWSPDGTLYFVSDRTGWWNLYRMQGEKIKPLCPMEAEFGKPLWIFKMSNYDFLEDGKIGCVYTIKGTDFLGILDPEMQMLETIDLPFTSYGSFCSQNKTLYFTAASETAPPSLIKYDTEQKKLEIIQKSKDVTIDTGYLSSPKTIEFPTANGKTAYAFYYAPKNKDYQGTDLPPLIVKSHGGPTMRVDASLNLEIQFWTSRGIAVLDVNYGGSTGYGREYRERLKGNWGIVDVEDCINGALFLANQGYVDRERMAIKGGSAGGYTTLAALTFHKVFKAGASYYGICDLEALCQDTHKFESRYNDGLIGPYPEAKEIYQKRSPIHYVDQLSSPVILFQGDEDKIVPSSQAEAMFQALKDKKIPTAYLLFKGEQHGFRISENIKKALDAELYFYGKVFGFTPSDSLEPIALVNFV